MSSKQITMTYAEYQADLAQARQDGWHDAKDRIYRILRLTNAETEMQKYNPDARRQPEVEILTEIFEHFFMD